MAPVYRNFSNPPQWVTLGNPDPTNTQSWLDWMATDNVTHDYRPFPENTCGFCGGPADGWPQCYHCRTARQYVDFLLAPSYSLDNGLESLVKRFKDFGNAWTGAPLASLLADVFERHGHCIENYLGVDAIKTWVPSNDAVRTFDHIEKLIGIVDSLGQLGWTRDVVVRNREHERPRPGAGGSYLKPEAYQVLSEVEGRNVLLLDDLWTSGASMVSTAAALKAAGAQRVLGVVLGRQLRRDNDHGTAPQVFAEVEARGWTFNDCGLDT